jgi:hypothetical protein
MIRPPRQVPASAPHEAAAVTERFTGVHIGSVEVEILPVPDSMKPPVAMAPAPPAPASATAVLPLARGFTSWIGLRQS